MDKLWEDLEYYGMTQRMKVPGGWLVRVKDAGDKYNALCFYSDPNHDWKI